MYTTGFLYFQVSFHPKDRSVVCIVGQGIFKVKTYNVVNQLMTSHKKEKKAKISVTSFIDAREHQSNFQNLLISTL